MRDQNFSNSPKQVFTPWWKSPPKRVHIEEKVTLTSFCWKSTLYKFLIKNLHTLIKLRIENHNPILPLEQLSTHVLWCKLGRKDWEKIIPFSHEKDKFQKYPFLPKILFWHPYRIKLLVKKIPFSHVFLVRHVYTVIFEWSPRVTFNPKWQLTMTMGSVSDWKVLIICSLYPFYYIHTMVCNQVFQKGHPTAMLKKSLIHENNKWGNQVK